MMSLVSVLGCGTWFFLIEEQLYCQFSETVRKFEIVLHV